MRHSTTEDYDSQAYFDQHHTDEETDYFDDERADDWHDEH